MDSIIDIHAHLGDICFPGGGELIGKNVKARSLKNKREIEGKIIDETKSTLVFKTKEGRKRLVKSAYAFEFPFGKKRIMIDGKYFDKKPEDRIKTKLR